MYPAAVSFRSFVSFRLSAGCAAFASVVAHLFACVFQSFSSRSRFSVSVFLGLFLPFSAFSFCSAMLDCSPSLGIFARSSSVRLLLSREGGGGGADAMHMHIYILLALAGWYPP